MSFGGLDLWKILLKFNRNISFIHLESTLLFHCRSLRSWKYNGSENFVQYLIAARAPCHPPRKCLHRQRLTYHQAGHARCKQHTVQPAISRLFHISHMCTDSAVICKENRDLRVNLTILLFSGESQLSCPQSPLMDVMPSCHHYGCFTNNLI